MKKEKICITLDANIIKGVDIRRLRFGMKRSSYINFRLGRIMKKSKRGII